MTTENRAGGRDTDADRKSRTGRNARTHAKGGAVKRVAPFTPGDPPATPEAVGVRDPASDATESSTIESSDAQSTHGEESVRARRIAEAAYLRAASRDFQPGREIDDWLDAEREIDGRKG